MAEARRLVRRGYGETHPPVRRALARFLAAMAWPPAVLIHLWQIRHYRGSEAVQIKRMPQALWVAMRHNVLPGEYYAYELWRPDRRAHVDDYLYSNEAARLFKLLNRPAQPDPIGDKLAFYEVCEAHAIPSPPVLAAFGPAGILREFERGIPPKYDLFIKPRLGLSGSCVERLRWDGTGFESNHGTHVSPEDVGEYLLMRAQEIDRTLFVQPLISNHHSLCIEGAVPLATTRLVTGRSKDGAVVPIFGFIYFARSGALTSQHGYVALIDVANGQLMPSPPPERSGAKHWDYLPEDLLDGIGRLPNWGDALRWTEIAHRACPNFVFVGWDIAFTDEGPKLIEGNANWTADEYQSLSGKPLGHTSFAELLAERLRSF